jgi:hypothetical protein
MSMMNVYEKCNDVLIESPLLFVHDTAHVKSIRVEQDVNQGPLAFCMRRCACKKYKSRMGCRSRAPCFLHCKDVLAHWSCVHLGVCPLHRLGMRF